LPAAHIKLNKRARHVSIHPAVEKGWTEQSRLMQLLWESWIGGKQQLTDLSKKGHTRVSNTSNACVGVPVIGCPM
jgi:hypothetical protein